MTDDPARAEPDEMLEALDAEEEAAIRADAAVPGAIGLGRTMVLRLLATLDAARHAATDDTAREPDGGWEAWIGDEEEVERLAATPANPAGLLREAGDGYEIQTWVEHQPSGVVVLKGHPQLGGRYCLTDGGDWPCSAVRAALAATGDSGGPLREDKP